MLILLVRVLVRARALEVPHGTCAHVRATLRAPPAGGGLLFVKSFNIQVYFFGGLKSIRKWRKGENERNKLFCS